MSTNRIDVQFGVSLGAEQIDALKQRLEKLRVGSVEYSATYDELLKLKKHYEARLEGECMAYMNIARRQLKEAFEVG